MDEAALQRLRRQCLALREFHDDVLSPAEEVELYGRRPPWLIRFLFPSRGRPGPMTDGLRDVWISRLRAIYVSDEEALAFLSAPHSAFAGATASSRIEAGKGADVENLIRQIEDGVYV
ncbi:MAG: DUF2384 domain-containing protein [Alphaproteobacteria bacterium]|nr:DUF2384 domain-containing protein [Alphaproteobacteria bacterium]